MNKNQTGTVGTIKHPKLAVTFADGSAGFSDRSVLKPDHNWKKHSGVAPVSGTKVHTLMSQKIEGTESFAICREGDENSGSMIAATKPELEVLMAGLGYEIKLKR